MKTLQDILRLSIQFLEKNKISRACLTSEMLLAHFLQLQRIELYMYGERPLEEEELGPFRQALTRVIKGEPFEQVIGNVEFFGAQIALSPSVLIPRQETEILVDKIHEQVKGRVLDLCTGSGCIAIALKKARPELEMVGADISKEALSLARQNGEKNGVDILWLEGDLTEPVKGKQFDTVICNPPYISEKEFGALSTSVRNFEPKIALVSGPTGDEFFERLEQELPPILAPGAQVFFEIGAGQGDTLLSIFSNDPWEGGELSTDWAGHDRFFSLKMKEISSILL